MGHAAYNGRGRTRLILLLDCDQGAAAAEASRAPGGHQSEAAREANVHRD